MLLQQQDLPSLASFIASFDNDEEVYKTLSTTATATNTNSSSTLAYPSLTSTTTTSVLEPLEEVEWLVEDDEFNLTCTGMTAGHDQDVEEDSTTYVGDVTHINRSYDLRNTSTDIPSTSSPCTTMSHYGLQPINPSLLCHTSSRRYSDSSVNLLSFEPSSNFDLKQLRLFIRTSSYCFFPTIY